MNDLDRAGRSKLHYAAADNDLELVRRLIAQGFDVNLRDSRDWTPLHFAAQSRAVEIAEVLLDNGAEIDARDAAGNTPLLTALFNSKNDPRTVRFLRDRGADPLSENNSGVSPHSLARVVANYDLVTILETDDQPRPGPF